MHVGIRAVVVACIVHTTGVDEDFHWTVIGVFVCQGDHNAGSRMGRGVSICPDGMGRALYSCIEKPPLYKYIKYTYVLLASGLVLSGGQSVSIGVQIIQPSL